MTSATAGTQLGKDVISTPQLRLILETFRDRLFTEIFPPGPAARPAVRAQDPDLRP